MDSPNRGGSWTGASEVPAPPRSGSWNGVEDAVRRERDLLSAVLSTSGALVVVLDTEGRIVLFNHACERLTGYAFEEVKGKPFWDELLVPEEAAKVTAVFQELRSGQFPNEHENHWTTRDGRRRLIMWSNTALLDDRGAVEFVIGTGIDITERTRAEEARRKSEEKYRQMVEALHEGIWVVDESDLTTFANDRLAEMLGYTPEEMRGAHLFSFMDERGIEICKRNLERRRRGVKEDHEFEFLRKDGTRIVALLHTSPITDARGDYRGAIAGVLDITERKLAEATLKEAHTWLEERVREQTRELRSALAELAELKKKLEAENLYLRKEVESSHDFHEIVGESPALRKVLYSVSQVAGTDSNVLILGETGTGKELLAHAIHGRSPRRDRPLIKVNCAALPAGLIDSELFGHEKGAFTGADTARAGRFELADGGTILLDEVGDLPRELQPKLLRVLQDGEFERLGSTRTQRVDVRVIAATNRDLEAETARGVFRSDLYFRLGVFPITVPPLRERRADIPFLVRYFIGKLQRDMAKKIESVPNEVMEALVAYDWPGNVRELQNVIERALILSPSTTLIVDESVRGLRAAALPVEESMGLSLKGIERAHILRVVEECGWRIKGRNNAAERLGLKPSTLRDRMKKLGIARPPRPGRESSV